MGEHVVASADDLGPGDRLVVEVEGREVGVFNLDGEYVAYTSWCPHQGGPLCEGPVSGTTDATFDRDTLEYELEWVKEDRIVHCPWHGWEFDLETGEGVHDPAVSIPSHPVRVEDGKIVVSI